MTNQNPSAKPTVYRGAGTFFGGLVVVVLCLLGALDLVIEAGSTDLAGAAVMLLVASLAFVYGVYPAAFSSPDALVVRNPFRTITLSWPAVTEIAARLSFLVYTEKTKFTVWAIPVSLRERRKLERDRMKSVSRERREAQRDARGGSNRPPRPAPDRMERLTYADQAVAEMQARRDQYAEQVRVDALRAAHAVGQARAGAPADQDGADQAAERSEDVSAAPEGPAAGGGAAGNGVTVRWAPLPAAVVGVAALLVILGFAL